MSPFDGVLREDMRNISTLKYTLNWYANVILDFLMQIQKEKLTIILTCNETNHRQGQRQ